MKTGFEATRKREMEIYKVPSVFSLLQTSLPVPVAAWSKVWVCWDCGFECQRGHGRLFVERVGCVVR